MVRSALRTLPAYSVFPQGRLRMVLEALEEAMYTGLTEKVVLPTDLTIEHVLPQEWSATLAAARWRRSIPGTA